MDMPMSTSTSSTGSMATAAAMDPSMMNMNMVFINAQNTALYSNAWTPSTAGAYAGTCIFLILLAVALRLLWAGKVRLEAKWQIGARNRRYVVVRGQNSEAGKIDSDPDAKSGSLLTVNGIEERVKIVQAFHQSIPFRLSVDLPRAALLTVIAGVGYLLMLAVMTMNIGYFISVLAGTFIGELLVGRYAQAVEHDH